MISLASKSSILNGFAKSRSMLAGNSGFDPSATWLIARVTATGGETSLSFTSIPQTYSHLQIRGIVKETYTGAGGSPMTVNFNSDTGSNYSWHYMYGNGSSVGVSGGGVSDVKIRVNGTEVDSVSGATSMYGAVILDVVDYANTNKYKTVKYLSGSEINVSSASYFINLGSGSWQSTSGVTRIDINAGSTSFVAGTTFGLYGYK